MTMRRPGNFSLESAIAVNEPSVVAITVVPRAMMMLLPMAVCQRGVPSTTSYQRVEKPSSGKTKNDPLLNDSGIGIRIGTTRNRTTRPHQSHSSVMRTRSPGVG